MHPSMIMFLELNVNLTDQWHHSGKVLCESSAIYSFSVKDANIC